MMSLKWLLLAFFLLLLSSADNCLDEGEKIHLIKYFAKKHFFRNIQILLQCRGNESKFVDGKKTANKNDKEE